jgi:large subunit ribosomal protein L4
MQLDIVNLQNQKVGTVDLPDEIFGGRVKTDLIWESTVHENASKRRGTHATKNRANVSGSGKKPWRQKGTGRARVGEIRNPLWRKGGTVFGPQPRSYDFALPKKVGRGALRAALSQRLRDGRVVVVDALSVAETSTKAAAALLKTLGADGKIIVIDVALGDHLTRSMRNIAGVVTRASNKVTARDVMNADRIVATKSAIERLQEALA